MGLDRAGRELIRVGSTYFPKHLSKCLQRKSTIRRTEMHCAALSSRVCRMAPYLHWFGETNTVRPTTMLLALDDRSLAAHILRALVRGRGQTLTLADLT